MTADRKKVSPTSTKTDLDTKPQELGLGPILMLFVFGVVAIVVALVIRAQPNIDPDWPRVSGEVIDLLEHRRSDTTTYATVVAYEVDGQQYRVRSEFVRGRSAAMGDTQEVAYNPADPRDAKVDKMPANHFLWVVFIFIGLFNIGMSFRKFYWRYVLV